MKIFDSEQFNSNLELRIKRFYKEQQALVDDVVEQIKGILMEQEDNQIELTNCTIEQGVTGYDVNYVFLDDVSVYVEYADGGDCGLLDFTPNDIFYIYNCILNQIKK